MKKLLLLFLSFFAINSFAQNISTGLDPSSSSSATMGANDGSWRYGIAINGTSIPKVINYYAGYWQPTPITSTGAQFIGNTGDYMAQRPGLYYFERTFSVAPGIGLLATNFSIAIDDELKSVELIDPSGNATDLTTKFIRSTTPSPYYLSREIKSDVKCPAPGKWKIRILVNFIDTAAGLLVSGNVNMSGQCSTDETYEDTKCCTGDKGQNLSTGFRNTSNTLIPNNSPDDDWKIIASPAGTPSAVVYSPSPIGYAPASTKAQWIGPKGAAGNGSYTYERTIVVPVGYEANLSFSRIGGDNEVDLFVDGTLQYHSSFPSSVGSKAFTAPNVILKKCLTVNKLVAGTHKITCIVDNQSLGTALLVEGCYELVQTACKCPEGWLSNTSNIDGDITLDGLCKKMVCGPINVKPYPKNGTQVDGNIGFFWDGNLYFYGTKANGGAAICPRNMGSSIEIKEDQIKRN